MYFKADGILEDEYERVQSYLSCFDIKVYLKSGGYGYIGKGSTGFLRRFNVFKFYKQTYSENNSPLRFDIGRYNNFAICKFLIGGEHNNKEFLNYSFGDNKIARKYAETIGFNSVLEEKGIKVGNFNVFSTDALVLDGSIIGDGNIFGARSMVLPTTKIDNYCVYIGSPAKIIKKRTDSFDIGINVNKINWNAVNLGDLLKYLETGNHNYLINKFVDTGKLVIEYDDKSTKFDVKVLGFEINNFRITADDFPIDIKEYFISMIDTNSKIGKVNEALFSRYMEK